MDIPFFLIGQFWLSLGSSFFLGFACLEERLWDDDLVLGTESSSAGNSQAMRSLDFYSSGGQKKIGTIVKKILPEEN